MSEKINEVQLTTVVTMVRDFQADRLARRINSVIPWLAFGMMLVTLGGAFLFATADPSGVTRPNMTWLIVGVIAAIAVPMLAFISNAIILATPPHWVRNRLPLDKSLMGQYINLVVEARLNESLRRVRQNREEVRAVYMALDRTDDSHENMERRMAASQAVRAADEEETRVFLCEAATASLDRARLRAEAEKI